MTVENGSAAPDHWHGAIAHRFGVQTNLEPLGENHVALSITQSPTLLVSFTTLKALEGLEHGTLPQAHAAADDAGYSALTIVTRSQDWFRDGDLYAYFDHLVDEGYFDRFDRVVFYGAGMGAHAAAAYSVAAPGSTVIALSPVATLAPCIAGWDRRHLGARRLNFTGRYGFAPRMIEGAAAGFVLYDPHDRPAAMHAALFHRPHVSLLRCPHLGEDLEPALEAMGILSELLDAAGEGALNPLVFHRLFRARRRDPGYLERLEADLNRRARPKLLTRVQRHRRGLAPSRHREG